MIEKREPFILLPYDFTEVTKCAVKHAVVLAKTFGFSIKLLNILDSGTKAFLNSNQLEHSDLEGKLQETCDAINKEHAVEADYYFKKGSIKTICRVADDMKASFMILGVVEPKGTKSEIMKMIGKCPLPVLVVQQDCEITSYKHILFPLDEFHASRQKTGWAAKLAKTTGAKISIVAVKQNDDSKLYKHRMIIHQVEEFFDKQFIKHETYHGSGPVSEFPIEALELGIELKCDVFVIMQRRPKALRSMDPFDRKLIFNKEKIPVMCVNLRDVGLAAGFN